MGIIPARFKRKPSENRKYLRIATYEGFVSVVVATLLGGPFLTGYILYLGGSPEQVGIVLAIPALANIVQIYMAFYMQNIDNRRLVMVITSGIHRILWAATGLIPFVFSKPLWVPVFIIMFTVAFISASASGIVWSSLIADMVPSKVRGRYFGIRNTILFAAGSLFLFIGGQLLEKYPGEKGFVYLFIIGSAFAILNVIFFFFYPNLPFEKSKEQNKMNMLRKPFENPVFLRGMLFISLWVFIQGISMPFFNYIMIDLLKISYQWVSIVTMSQTIVMMISYYIWGNLNVRFSSRTLLLWTLPILALSCMLWGTLWFMPVMPVLFLVNIFLGIGSGGFNQMMFNFLIGDSPKSERPMFIGVFSALTGVMGFVGPLVGGVIYKYAVNLPAWVAVYGIATATGIVLFIIAVVLGPAVFRDRPVVYED